MNVRSDCPLMFLFLSYLLSCLKLKLQTVLLVGMVSWDKEEETLT